MKTSLKSKKVCSLSCMILIITFSFFFSSATQLAYAQQTRWYAGYSYYGSQKTYAHEGVSGKIYTINPYVTGYNFIAEWVTIVLSYTYGYWLQLGYTKGWDTNYQLVYYYEYSSKWGYGLVFLQSGPGTGTWHSYLIGRPYAWGDSNDPYEWRFYIDGPRVATQRVDPYRSVDEQAFVETTTTSIIIDGSHFRELRYPRPPNWFWYYWLSHVPYADAPYWLVEVSHYEFYANGGV